MAKTETGRQLLADYHHLAASRCLKANALLESDPLPDIRPQSTLFSLAQLLESPGLIWREIQNNYPDADLPRIQKARVSVLQQNLALQIIWPLVIRLFRDGNSIALNPDQVFLKWKDNDLTWLHLANNSEPLETQEFINALSEQLQKWYPVFRHQLGVSPGAYWSSVGLALGAPYSMIWNQVNPEALCKQANHWLSQFHCEANKHIDWIPAEFNQQRCAIPQRRGCCLKYLLPDEGYCGTCGVHRKKRMAQIETRQTIPQASKNAQSC
ncbi:(2Fe-2S)-binding protein [Marinobacter sp. AL4B]|uniref:(2Fe-2S)-binding protein n=1 Tax=Marinobacter sp. AL4B TaxID=2871173 RepID=UPI001CAA55CF|nr:(2Fe-2S)-binding protein [Marinobacter sp. AL4B]MBZ0334249.1 (2Fe-2S)-binding protein [Marinobacter sp. AL4B]